MSLALVYSRALSGMNAPLVEVEAHLANGLPHFNIVGLPDTEVKESRDRVRAAIIQSGFEFPAKKITVNLAPADLPKESGRFDLPIAIGILAASGQVAPEKLAEYEFAGELALSGLLRPVRGALAMAWQGMQAKRAFVLPEENAGQAAVMRGITVYGARSLGEVAAHLNGIEPLVQTDCQVPQMPSENTKLLDLVDVKGQHTARLALEIAAAGGHSLLMMGPPGTGKSMLSQRLPGILPPLTEDELVEVWALRSLLPNHQQQLDSNRPFRITAPARRLWSAAVRIRVRAKFHWRITAFYFWMNCPSSTAKFWKFCANRWKTAKSTFPERRAKPSIPPNSNLSPP